MFALLLGPTLNATGQVPPLASSTFDHAGSFLKASLPKKNQFFISSIFRDLACIILGDFPNFQSLKDQIHL